jgi:hypothetical protein
MTATTVRAPTAGQLRKLAATLTLSAVCALAAVGCSPSQRANCLKHLPPYESTKVCYEQ